MLDPAGGTPLYQQLGQVLRKRIEDGAWGPHSPIPPERELTERYGVSRITVRQAIADLVAEGLLYRRQGSGTFVAERRPAPIATTLTHLIGHVEELQQRGFNPEVEVLGLGKAALPAHVARALGRPEGAEAWHITRLVRLDNLPLMLLDGYVPADLGLGLEPRELARMPVPRLLEEFGLVPVQGVLRIEAAEAGSEQAAALGIRPQGAVLQVTRVITGRDGAPLEWSQALCRSDRYHYEVQLRRR